MHIAALRKALGDDRSNPQFIETLHRRGCRYVAAVREVSEEGELSFYEILRGSGFNVPSIKNRLIHRTSFILSEGSRLDVYT